ncbi:MAG: lysoplasmalogenase family protein [Trueperaceae bacterium]
MGWSLVTLSVWVTTIGVAVALVASRRGMPRAYLVAKLVASLGFLVAAVAVGAMGAAWTRLAFAALALSAAGDVALAVRTKTGFLVGLGCFALAHVVYTLAFAVHGLEGAALVPTAFAGAIVGGGAWLAFGRRVSGSLRVLVAAYAVILSTMLAVGEAAAITHRAWWLGLGVLLVTLSDVAVARERFGTPGFVNKMVGLPTYYLGQMLIAVNLSG